MQLRGNIDNKEQRLEQATARRFQDLPEEITTQIFSLADQPSILTKARFAQTCKSFSFFQPDTATEAPRMLMEAVLNGHELKVLRMIALNIDWLFTKTKCIDNSGREIEGSPWQAMLGAEDIDMCQKAKLSFEILPSYCDTALQQYNEQLPERIICFGIKEDIYNTLEIYDFTTLINAITKEQFTDGQVSQLTNDELQKFRKDFASPDIINTGTHFNVRILIAAMLIYNNHSNDWAENQRSLFWCQVIGYLQRLLPVCYRQAIRQGLFYIMDQQADLIRSTSDSDDKLGYDFAIYSGDGEQKIRDYCKHPLRNECDRLLNYVVKKEQSLDSLMKNLGKVNSLNEADDLDDVLVTERRDDWFVVDCESDRNTHHGSKNIREKCVIS